MITFVTTYTARGKRGSSLKFRDLTHFVVVDRSRKAVKYFVLGVRKRHEEKEEGKKKKKKKKKKSRTALSVEIKLL